jgi:isopenicillin-N epimerase
VSTNGEPSVRRAGARNGAPSPHACAARWALDPSVVFLNHGSFGATPRAILAVQNELRARMEREPVAYFVQELEGELDAARVRLSGLVGCDPEGFAFVRNATAGVSTIMRSLALGPGDEILTTSHDYNACVNAAREVSERAGARVVVASVAWPLPSGRAAAEDAIVSAVLAGVSARTRLAMISHVTSPTGFVMPIERLVRELLARGVETLVDAAHAPACVEMNVSALGCAYCTGNFHKWLCAPKGSAFVYVREDLRAKVMPLVVSHGRNSARTGRSRFRLNFDFQGSEDATAWLATPSCAPLLGEIMAQDLGIAPSWAGCAPGVEADRAIAAAYAAHLRAGAIEARARLCARFGTEAPVPEGMLGPMGAVMLPAHEAELDARLAACPSLYGDALQDALLERWGVQVPIIRFPGLAGRWVRLSRALYNTPAQYDYLGEAVLAELARERQTGG